MASVDGSIHSERVTKRTGNACDACRARKVKCNYATGQQICDACNNLDVECVAAGPRKRRGPPNRYAVEQRRKAARLLPPSRPSPPVISPSSVAEQSSNLISTTYTLETFAPMAVIRRAIDDWFEYIHPIAPILHRDSYLIQLSDSQRRGDVDFVCLTISICAAVVATLRRRASEYAAPIINVHQCDQTIQSVDQFRGCPPLTLSRCLTRYNLAIAYAANHGMDHPESQVRMAEVTAMVGHAVHYNLQNLSVCDRELLKRLYWLCFSANCTLGLHGRPFVISSMTSTNNEALGLQIVNDNDLCDVRMNDGVWHGHNTSYVPGLNVLVELFRLWYQSQQGDTSSQAYLQLQLDKVLVSLDHIPPELRWRGGLSRSLRGNFGTDAQMVNLYITQIHIRSFLLEQMYHAACKSQSSDILQNILNSRQSLVNDMLTIVYQMPDNILEANGNSLIDKLRSIGLALLDDSESDVSFVNLDRLLAKLDTLDIQPEMFTQSLSPDINLADSGIAT